MIIGGYLEEKEVKLVTLFSPESLISYTNHGNNVCTRQQVRTKFQQIFKVNIYFHHIQFKILTGIKFLNRNFFVIENPSHSNNHLFSHLFQ